MGKPQKLGPSVLYHRCDPAQFKFETTAELPDFDGEIGQQRARGAVEFGLGIARHGYNLFVMGPAGSGKRTLVRRHIEQGERLAPPLLDWVYVNNFEQPHKPVALSLPAGRGRQLREDMQQLVEELGSAIPAVFESDEYRTRIEQIDAEFNERQENALTELGKDAASRNIGLLRTPTGFSLAPLKDGEVISAEDYARLPEDEQQRLERDMGELRTRLERIFRQMRQWRREHRDKVRELNREVTLFAVGNLVEELKERYTGLDKVLKYLEAVKQDVIDNVDDFRRKEEGVVGPFGMPVAEPPSFRRYLVNVIVDRSETNGAAVVFEDNPNYQNLLGRIEHIAQFGTLVTDFSLIKPGALHRANGGYLMLDVYKLLTQPFAWDALKRALSTREIRIESLAQMYSLVSTVSLEPEPIPLDLKVVLFGERMWYYLLHAWDPDFRELFKVVADFEEEVERSAEIHDLYARLIATIARRGGMLPFERGAVARVIEHGGRRVSDAKKLSTNVQECTDLLSEADFYARRAGALHVLAKHVQQAIDAQLARADRLRARLQETILRGTIMIDTAGARVGQVNGLSVFELGNFTFGEPTRITATTRLGDGNVIDVQREVELGGAIHSKGVLILSAFLAARFSTRRLHSLSASLVFEQTYGTVDGDSASVAELAALMSSLAELPIRQSLAVTGSVNQLGQVQAIGGVNEKIEGFFDICKARGLSGEQGVVIPSANIEHLMLREDVVQAVAEGKFHIHAVSTVDEAVELLTGVEAGVADAAGEWPADSVNGRVARRLRQFAELRVAYVTGKKQGGRPAKGSQ
ncbi:MAG: Lon protease family protein [Burkholderiales bacterium]